MPWPADLDPALLTQPDPRSCGAAALLAACAIVEGWRPTHAGEEILHAHAQLTSATSARDRFQMPWPRAWGTPPWALANAVTALTGRRTATVHVRPRPEIGFDVLAEEAERRPTFVYVGSRWVPRHVVLAVRRVGAAVEVFDPATGSLRLVAEDRWAHHRLDLGGWSHFWFVV